VISIFGITIYPIPFGFFTLTTSLKLEEVERRLRLTIGTTKNDPIKEIFTGRLGKDWFLIRRKINYRNDFRSTIYGKVVQSYKGTNIRIFIFINPFILVFASLPFLFGAAYSSFSWWLIFLGALTIIGFNYDANRCEEELLEILDERRTFQN